MIEQNIAGHKLIFYDGIEDLPITQFHRYGKYLLVEGGIGDSIQDIDKHITRVINFLDDKKKAYQELLNLRQCLFAVATEQDIRNKATLCLIKSVDGEDWMDFSDDGLQKLYLMLSGDSYKNVMELATEVRGAIDENLTRYFPSVFEDSLEKNYTDLLRKRAVLQLNAIVDGRDNTEDIQDLTKKIFAMQTPKNFEGAESEEIKFDKQFEYMCLLMAKEFGGGIKKFTTMEFYTAYERMLKDSEEQKNLAQKRRNK